MHPQLPAATPAPAPHDGTDPREPAMSMAYLTAALVAVATDVGYDIDTDEMAVTTGLRCDLVLAWVLAGSQVLVHRYLRSLLDEPIEVMRTAIGRDGVSLHADELADVPCIRRSPGREDAGLDAGLPHSLLPHRPHRARHGMAHHPCTGHHLTFPAGNPRPTRVIDAGRSNSRRTAPAPFFPPTAGEAVPTH